MKIITIATLSVAAFAASIQAQTTSFIDFNDPAIREALTGTKVIAKDPDKPQDFEIWKTLGGKGFATEKGGEEKGLPFVLGDGKSLYTGIWRQDMFGDVAICFAGTGSVAVPYSFTPICGDLDMYVSNFGAILFADHPDVRINVSIFDISTGQAVWSYNGFDPDGWPTGSLFDAASLGFGGAQSADGFTVEYTGYNAADPNGPVMFDKKNVFVTHTCVPEPSSSFFILSALAFMIRRRKR